MQWPLFKNDIWRVSISTLLGALMSVSLKGAIQPILSSMTLKELESYLNVRLRNGAIGHEARELKDALRKEIILQRLPKDPIEELLAMSFAGDTEVAEALKDTLKNRAGELLALIQP